MATNGIKEIKIDSTNYLIEPTLYTSAALASGETSVYVATLDNFELFNGVAVNVKFSADVSAGATLNINSTGGKPIYYNGASIAANTLIGGNTYTLIYNGTQWEVSGTLKYTYALSDLSTAALTTSTVNTHAKSDIIKSSSAGKFFGNSSNVDFIGLELRSSNDGFQLVAQFAADKNTLLFRQNDNSTITSSNWSNWQQLVHTTFSGGAGGAGSAGNPTATSESEISATPVYVNTSGVATPIAFTIGKSVPTNAVFTDTTYTAATNGGLTLDSNNQFSLVAATYNTIGGVMPAYTSTNSATLTTPAAANTNAPTLAAKTTTADRYYAIEADKNGILYVNVPWENTSIDTLQNISLATTTKAYITGVSTTPTAIATAMTAVADIGVYLTTTAGELSAVQHSWNVAGTEKAYTIYDATNDCINFVFA